MQTSSSSSSSPSPGVRTRRTACHCAPFRVINPYRFPRCSDPFTRNSSHSHRPMTDRGGHHVIRGSGRRIDGAPARGEDALAREDTRGFRARETRTRGTALCLLSSLSSSTAGAATYARDGSDCRGRTREIVLAAACASAAARRRRRRIAISKVRVDKNVTRDARDRAPAATDHRPVRLSVRADATRRDALRRAASRGRACKQTRTAIVST